MSFNYQLPAGETRELMPFEVDEHFPQCQADCSQGRRPCQREDQCIPAEASTELGSDEYGPMYPLTPVEVRSLTVIGIIALAALVSFVAFIARYF